MGKTPHSRLAGAQFDEDSFCSVADLGLSPRRAIQRNECCIGDALTMSPPVTGNGMLMAFESAKIAIGPLICYSRGELYWAQAQQEIARRCDRAFARRLRRAAWLQWALFQPSARMTLLFVAALSAGIWRGMFERTR